MANGIENQAQLIRLRVELGTAFSPTGPVSSVDLFKGRTAEVNTCIAAVGQIGQHVILYGERGVGKTSLASLVDEIWNDVAKQHDFILSVRYNCEPRDTFQTIWANVAELINDTLEKRQIPHPNGESWLEVYADVRGELGTPHTVRRLLDLLNKKCIIVIDEFDQIEDAGTIEQFSSAIKGLSDHLVDATIILVGVADTVEELIADHASIARNLAEVPMPRMSTRELNDIIRSGYQRVSLDADEKVVDLMGRLAQGLPHYAHRFGQEAGYAAVARDSREVKREDVTKALRRAVALTHEPIRKAYNDATTSPQKDALFAKVLLACALADVDDLDFFSAGDIREPLAIVARKRYDIPQFVGHLKKFCGPDKGPVLEMTGEEWKRRYRFLNPLMRPYVVLRGIQDGLISEDSVSRFEHKNRNGEAPTESAQQKRLL